MKHYWNSKHLLFTNYSFMPDICIFDEHILHLYMVIRHKIINKCLKLMRMNSKYGLYYKKNINVQTILQIKHENSYVLILDWKWQLKSVFLRLVLAAATMRKFLSIHLRCILQKHVSEVVCPSPLALNKRAAVKEVFLFCACKNLLMLDATKWRA